jgi:hypothetical protein
MFNVFESVRNWVCFLTHIPLSDSSVDTEVVEQLRATASGEDVAIDRGGTMKVKSGRGHRSDFSGDFAADFES